MRSTPYCTKFNAAKAAALKERQQKTTAAAAAVQSIEKEITASEAAIW